MSDEEVTQTTLRDTIEQAYDEHVTPESSQVTPATGAGETTTPPSASADGTSPPAETAEQRIDREALEKANAVKNEEKPGRTAGRARDEHGRLLPGKAEEPVKPRPARPSSWKKEMWDHWEKLDPTVAEYLHQRESEFAKGVSTYKTEWEKAKPLLDAIAPYQQDFERWGINPAQQFARYAEIHKSLALGTPQQKLSTFLRVAQEYQIPVQELFVQGQDGKVYFNQQLMQQAQQQVQQPQQQAPDVQKLVAQTFAQHLAQQQAQQFIEAKDAQGNPVHPHYETVREDMAQLLEAGLADDIPSAYDAALGLPKHRHLLEAQQRQQREKDEAEKQRKAREEADRARRNNVSPRTATPSGTAGGAKKGLRAQLEEAYDQHTAGRV